MKVLFDQGTPVPLRRALTGHRVVTVYEQGWSTLVNGRLLEAAEAQSFDVFVTTDSPAVISRSSCSAQPPGRAFNRMGTRFVPRSKACCPVPITSFWFPNDDRAHRHSAARSPEAITPY
jgi:hypothetical protein